VHEVGGGLDVGHAAGVDGGEEVTRGLVDGEAAVGDVGREVGQGAERAVVTVGELDLDALAVFLVAAFLQGDFAPKDRERAAAYRRS